MASLEGRFCRKEYITQELFLKQSLFERGRNPSGYLGYGFFAKEIEEPQKFAEKNEPIYLRVALRFTSGDEARSA